MSKFMIFVIVLVALITGVIFYNKVLHPQFSSSDKSAPKNRIMRVNGYVVQPRSLENSILTSGTLIASEDIDLHAEVSGVITVLNIKEGAHVGKGTLLVKLFDDDLQAQLKKSKVQKETAEKTEQRLKQLLEINGVNQQDYDNALLQVKSTEADMENMQAQIEKTEIRAPFSGIVGLKNVSIGAYLTPTTSVASLQQINPLKLDFTIPEKYASTIKTGDQVQFTVAGFTTPFMASVVAIEPLIDTNTRTIKVRANVKNADAKLLPGAFATIDLSLKTIENALMVPTQCVIPDLRESKVVVSKNGTAKFVTIQTGIREDTMVQITNGLQVGDTVVTSALMSIKPNIKINAVIGDEHARDDSKYQRMPTQENQPGPQVDHNGKN